jgi:pimeloyl-ACP methyl ester carboxylesterase
MPKIRVNEINLYYEISGRGEPLLLLHGLGSSVRDWEKQLPTFPKQFQVIACDLRGHGRTEKPPGPYSVPLFAADVAHLIKSLNFEPVHVLGISMGGMIAYQLAVSYPDLVQSLIVANAAPELLVRGFRERLNVWQREMIVRLIGMRKMGEVLSERLFIKPEQEKLRQVFVKRWSENTPRAYLASMRAIVGWSVVDQLHNINAPVLVISADQDYTFVSGREGLSRLPQAEFVTIQDSRHATPVEHPEQFNRVVLSFLSKGKNE